MKLPASQVVKSLPGEKLNTTTIHELNSQLRPIGRKWYRFRQLVKKCLGEVVSWRYVGDLFPMYAVYDYLGDG